MASINSDIAMQMAICACKDGYPVSLEVRKVYEVLPDAAATHSLIRVIDESGKDYLYPANYLIPIELPEAVREAILLTVKK